MNLQTLKQKFEAIRGVSVSERGTGDAKFLYISSARRAVEVADADEGIWIEYWDDTDKEDEKQIKEEIVSADEEAFAKIKQWLTVQ